MMQCGTDLLDKVTGGANSTVIRRLHSLIHENTKYPLLVKIKISFFSIQGQGPLEFYPQIPWRSENPGKESML